MATYFVFSDEAGGYRSNPDLSFCIKQPYYVRSGVIIDVDSWNFLKSKFFELKRVNNIPTNKEIKWSYLWSLTKHANNKEIIPIDKPYYFLKDYSLPALYDFVIKSCELLSECPLCKIVLTVTFNEFANSWSKATIYKMHLQEIMQRIEMEIQDEENNLAILFFDSTDRNVDNLLREAYSRIYFQGDFIQAYAHIKDSISFELSHQSFGVQIADYAAGSFNGFLRDYKFSSDLFDNHLCKLLRREKSTGKILGFGIREVPSNKVIRSHLESRLTKLTD